MRAQNLLLSAVIAMTCTACNLKYIDQVPPAPWDYYWTKEGTSNYQTKEAYYSCGYADKGWSMQMQATVDECMLKNGFAYRDHPYFKECTDFNPKYKMTMLPSCQSLKK